MKVRNKLNGNIETLIITCDTGYNTFPDIESLFGDPLTIKRISEIWEDCEEPKSGIESIRLNDMISGRHIVEIDFTKVEEAEKAVEKLKAWKRLKDNGFRFKRCEIIDGRIDFMILPKGEYREKVYDDLDLLFGGEE